METLNDVMDYADYFFGKDEPPVFHHEHFDLQKKQFVPVDDFSLCSKLNLNSKEDVILHYFVRDTCQNRLLHNNLADKTLHNSVYAVTSPDFSADQQNCFSCLNEANILKSRICAYRWQSELDERVLLTWLWSGPNTYKWAFGNVEKGTPGVVSSQGVIDWENFEDGIKTGIEMIHPDFLCWYGKIPEFINKYYDLNKIVQMQTRTELLKELKYKNQSCMVMQDALF